jgi:hypothetical protein
VYFKSEELSSNVSDCLTKALPRFEKGLVGLGMKLGTVLCWCPKGSVGDRGQLSACLIVWSCGTCMGDA